MTTYGQIFYSKQGFFGAEAGESDISLTAGLISAIYSMTTETQDQKITELELEQDRSVFRELPGEKLFIITVDKRMDTSDADDLISVLVDRFNQKYGDVVMDGMILSDFEPIVDEIVEEKLWYNTTEKTANLKDYGVLLAVMLGAIFYPYMLLNGQDTYVDPLKNALEDGFVDLLLQSLLLGVLTILPISLITYITMKFSKLGETFKFTKEFLRRPTRGGYSEVLPNWFLMFPVIAITLFVATIRFGRGIMYAVSLQALPDFLDNTILYNGNQVFWLLVYIYIACYLFSWFVIFPGIIGIFTQELNWRFIKSSWIVIGISLLAFLPGQIISGIYYQQAIGFHPLNQDAYKVEAVSLEFLFKVTLLGNLFLFLFIFLLAIGISQLITENKGRYPIGLGLGLFVTIAIQLTLFWFIFNSEELIEGKVFP
jgi:hypothetical protein